MLRNRDLYYQEMHAKTLFYFILGLSARFGEVLTQDESCDYLGTLFYEAVGCKAVSESDNSCPTRYSCPTNKNDRNICYHEGQRYYEGEEIKIPGSCMNCTCKSGYKQGHIVCKSITCPEQPQAKDGCYYRSNSFECCALEEYCPNDNSTSKVQCEYNGIVYTDGDYFQPPNSCEQCICSEGFKGIIEEPYCQPTPCLVDVYNQREVKNRCSPLYSVYQDTEKVPLCCPFNFICEENILKATYITRGETSEEGKCFFNGGYYNKGDSLEVSYAVTMYESFAKCTCMLPPLMTCIATYPEYPIEPVVDDVEGKRRNRYNQFINRHLGSQKKEKSKFQKKNKHSNKHKAS